MLNHRRRLTTVIDDVRGDTPLHQKIRHGTRLDEINQFIHDMGEEKISAMSKILNDKGQLAIHLVYDSRLSSEEKAKLDAQLLTFTTRYQGCPFDEPIDTDVILSRYDTANEALRFNLMSACWVINEVRSIIKKSTTHPDYDSYSQDKKFSSAVMLTRMRQSTSARDMHQRYTHSDSYLDVGNCQECSYLGLHFLATLQDPIYAEIFSVQGGNHCFIVIGRHPQSDARNPKTWGQTAVIADAWKGEACPAYDMPKHISTCTVLAKEGLEYNVMTSFNPHYHQLNRVYASSGSLIKRYVTPRNRLLQLNCDLWHLRCDNRHGSHHERDIFRSTSHT
jgi:hypothetical protein